MTIETLVGNLEKELKFFQSLQDEVSFISQFQVDFVELKIKELSALISKLEDSYSPYKGA